MAATRSTSHARSSPFSLILMARHAVVGDPLLQRLRQAVADRLSSRRRRSARRKRPPSGTCGRAAPPWARRTGPEYSPRNSAVRGSAPGRSARNPRPHTVNALRPCSLPNASWMAASIGLAVTSVQSFGIGRGSRISREVSAAALRYSGSSAKLTSSGWAYSAEAARDAGDLVRQGFHGGERGFVGNARGREGPHVAQRHRGEALRRSAVFQDAGGSARSAS